MMQRSTEIFPYPQTGSVSSSFMPSAVSPPLVASASTLNSHPVPIPSSSSSSPHTPSPQANLAVVGSLAVDITLSPSHSPHQTTSPGTVSLTLGGVASNVAGAAHSLLQGSNVLLVAPVGKDLLGDVARSGLKKRGMREDGLIEVGEGEGESRSATCGILLDEKGGLVGGVADMAITAGVEGKKVRLSLLIFLSPADPVRRRRSWSDYERLSRRWSASTATSPSRQLPRS